MSAPSRRLKYALKGITRVEGIEPRLVLRAATGQPVSAATYLKLCARLGFDPVTGKPAPSRELGELHLQSLGAALFMKRINDRITLRQAASRSRMSYSALWRIEAGHAVSIEATLAVCKFMKRHPHEFVSPVQAMGKAA